jgi:hypothetical protein
MSDLSVSSRFGKPLSRLCILLQSGAGPETSLKIVTILSSLIRISLDIDWSSLQCATDERSRMNPCTYVHLPILYQIVGSGPFNVRALSTLQQPCFLGRLFLCWFLTNHRRPIRETVAEELAEYRREGVIRV